MMLDPALYPIVRGPEPVDKDPAERLLRELHSLEMQEIRSRGYGDAVETKAEYDGLKSGLGELNTEWNERLRYAYGVQGQAAAQAAIDGTIGRTSAGYAAKRMRDDPASFGKIEGGIFRRRGQRRYALECTGRLAELLEERAKIETRMEGMQRQYDNAERLLSFALTPERRAERMLKLGAMMRGLTSDERATVQRRIDAQAWVVLTRAWVMAEEKVLHAPAARGAAAEGKPGPSGWGAAMEANRRAEHALQELAREQGEQVVVEQVAAD